MNARTVLLCPRDRHPLEQGAIHDTPMHKCPSCQGILLLQKQVNRLLETLTRGLLRTIPADAPLDRIPDLGGGLSCPACAEAMEHYGYMGDHAVMVDACHACRLLWLDPGELAAMCVQYARTERRLEASRLQMERLLLEAKSRQFAMDLAEAVERRLVRRFRW